MIRPILRYNNIKIDKYYRVNTILIIDKSTIYSNNRLNVLYTRNLIMDYSTS